MDFENKKLLTSVVYYTLAILTLLMSAFFIYVLSVRDVVMWAKVVYYIWTGFVIGVIIFDIICTTNRQAKTIAGFVVYVLSLLAVAMAVILYFVNSGTTGIPTDFFNLFISVSLISLFTTGLMIATWSVGDTREAESELIERK